MLSHVLARSPRRAYPPTGQTPQPGQPSGRLGGLAFVRVTSSRARQNIRTECLTCLLLRVPLSNHMYDASETHRREQSELRSQSPAGLYRSELLFTAPLSKTLDLLKHEHSSTDFMLIAHPPRFETPSGVDPPSSSVMLPCSYDPSVQPKRSMLY